MCSESVYDAESTDYWESWLGFIGILLVIKQLHIEYVQLFHGDQKVYEYFTNFVNITDLVQYFLNTMLIIMTIAHVKFPSLEVRRVMCSFLVCIIWSKMFDWMRMFDSTSFYIKLIIVTVYDILPFFAIFPIFLMTFGTSLYILSMNRGEENMD